MRNLAFSPKLTKAERKLIRKIAKLQLASLTRILTNRVEVDIPVHCLEYEIQERDLKLQVHNSYDQFARTLTQPAAFFNLDDDNLSICKSLLMGVLAEAKGKRKLWGKIRVLQNFDFNLN